LIWLLLSIIYFSRNDTRLHISISVVEKAQEL
jgi:hypothetical protein